jgi:hypothetical protein
LYHVGFTIHLQERLGQFSNLSYNELASAAIDQERLMKAMAEADEKERKRTMPGSFGLAVLLPSTAWCIPHLGGSCTDCSSSRSGAIAHNSNRSNSNGNNRNSSCSIVLLVTPRVTESLIKLIKLQLSPNARLIKSPKFEFEFKGKE